MKDIAHFMRFLGMTDGEIKTYETALKKGSSTVVDLAKESGLSRQSVYDAIDSLTERGLISSLQVGKKRMFAAEVPSKLLAYAKRRDADMKEQIAELEESLPALELRMGGVRPIVRLYEGKEGVQAYFVDMQNQSAEEVYEFADADALFSLFSEKDFGPVRKTIKRQNTKVFGLYREDKPKERPADRYSATDIEPFKSNLTVYNDKVALVSLEGKIFTVIIESKPIADALRILIKEAIKARK